MKKRLYLGLECSLDSNEWIHFPVIKIVPKQVNTDFKLDQYTHFIFTSKSTVKILAKNIPENRIVISVGSQTSAALKNIHVTPHYTAKEETAEGVVEVLEGLDLKSAHVFWPHSALSRSVLPGYFDRKRIRYTECILYDTVLNVPGPLPDLQNIEEILFTSPSTVDNFLILCPSIPLHIKLTAIGPVTQEHLLTKGLKNYFGAPSGDCR